MSRRIAWVGVCSTLAFLLCSFDWPTKQAEPATNASPTIVNEQTTSEAVATLEALAAAPTLDEDVMRAVRDRLFSPVPEVRIAAIEVLENHGLEDDRALLIRLLVDDSEDVRVAAIHALESYGSRATVVALSGTLGEATPNTARAAIEVLGRLGQWEATLPIIDVMLGHDSSLRQAAIEALGALGDPRAVPALAVRFDSEDYETVGLVVRALGQIGTVEALQALLRRMIPGSEPARYPLSEIRRAMGSAPPEVIVEAFVREGGISFLHQIPMHGYPPFGSVVPLFDRLVADADVETFPRLLLAPLFSLDGRAERADLRRLILEKFTARIDVEPGDATIAQCAELSRRASSLGFVGPEADESARLTVLELLRLALEYCDEGEAGALAGNVADPVAIDLIEALDPNDPVRHWLLLHASPWDTLRSNPSLAWRYVAAIDESPLSIVETARPNLGVEGLAAVLAYGVRREDGIDWRALLDGELREGLPDEWFDEAVPAGTHASNLRSSTGHEEEDRAIALAVRVQAALFDCDSLDARTLAASTDAAERWLRSLADLYGALCDRVPGDHAPTNQALDRDAAALTSSEGASVDASSSRNPSETVEDVESPLEFSPGADAEQVAAELWARAVRQDLRLDDAERCMRYSLGMAQEEIRGACLLAVRRMVFEDSELRALQSKFAEKFVRRIPRDANDRLTRIVVTDSTTGAPLWGAPVTLFLTDGRVLRTTVGVFGFLAVPKSLVRGATLR